MKIELEDSEVMDVKELATFCFDNYKQVHNVNAICMF